VLLQLNETSLSQLRRDHETAIGTQDQPGFEVDASSPRDALTKHRSYHKQRTRGVGGQSDANRLFCFRRFLSR